MKGRFWKKALAACLALLIVSGGVPVQPFSRVFERTAITANAAGYNVAYIDADGNAQTASQVDVVDESMDDNDYLFASSNGWLYVNSDVTLTKATNNGTMDTNIILGDGATLTINGWMYFKGASLTIYCQSGGTGKLVINSDSVSYSALGTGRSKTLTVNGGIVQVKNTNQKGHGFAGNFVMNGGTVSFEGGSWGYGMYMPPNGTVTYNGGSLTITGGNGGIDEATITLNNKSADNRINVSSYGSGTVTIAEGKYFKDSSGNYYSGTLTSAEKTAIAGQTLQSAYPHTITIADDITNGTITTNRSLAEENDTVTLTVTPDKGYHAENVSVNGTAITPTEGVYSFEMPADNAAVSAEFTANSHTVTYKVDGEIYGEVETVDYGTELTAREAPTKTGFIFSGWSTIPETMPDEDVVITGTFTEITYTFVSENTATCTEDGNIAYYEGSDGNLYTLKDGVYTEILAEDAVIKATGHTYGEPVWTWAEDHSSASAKFTCVKGDDEQTVNAVVTSETIAPTFEADGKIVYTAKATINGTEYTDTKEVAIPKKVLVATVGDEKYDSLKAAVDAADGDEVIVVYADVSEPDVDLGYDTTYGSYYKDIEIDLNGHTVTVGTIATGYSLTVKNGTLNCAINNASNYNATLTLDNAVLNTPEPKDEYSQGISWNAAYVEVKNGSTLVLKGNAYFGGWYDSFVLNIDETSSVVMNNVMLSGSDEETVIAQFSNYLPDGYSFGYDDEAYSYRIFNADGDVVTEAVTLKIPEKTDISSAKITLDTNSFDYDGTAKTVTYTVKVGDKVLTEGTDFTFEGDATATNAGVYIIKVKGINNYEGTAQTTWKIVPPAITVTINGTAIEQTYTYNKSLTVTAPEAEEGKKFSHWEVNGKAVSYSATYSFIVKESVNLVPVYVEDTAAVEQQAVLTLNTSKGTYNGKNAICFNFTHSVPEGYTVQEVGLLYGTNKLVGADTTVSGYAAMNLTDTTAAAALGVADVESVVKNNTTGKVKKFVANYKKLNGTVTFTYQLSVTAYANTIGYVKVVNAEGKTETLYSNFIATNYNNA